MHTFRHHQRSILVVLTSSLLILLFYLVSTHPFEIPDEQSHYASVHFLVEEGRMPTMNDPQNLSTEEHLTEEIFGIMSEGENRYSFHPEYRVEQVGELIGKYEGEIKSYNTPDNRRSYTIHQSALYPPLYYWFSSIFYRTVYSADIIMRLFVTRFSSLIITAFLPLLAYFLTRQIWDREYHARTIALMTLFFPMTAYLGVGVNSDNLHVVLFTLALILALNLIKNGWSSRNSLLIGIVIGLDLITKPQAYILFPIFALAVVVRWRWSEWRLWLRYLPHILLPIILIAGYQEIPKLLSGNSSQGATAYIARVVEYGGADNFRTFLSGYLSTHLREMPVWYWGVFKWFGVILPRPFWWIANRLVGLSVIGLIIQFARDMRERRLSWHSRVVIFSILANLVYALALFWFDWQFYQEYGRSLGLQARYYMPLLVTQLSLLYMGLLNLGWNNQVKSSIRHGLILFFLSLQLISLYTQLTSYYNLWPLSTFISQISQYKPVFAKGTWWYLWITLYFAGIISFTTYALKGEDKK